MLCILLTEVISRRITVEDESIARKSPKHAGEEQTLDYMDSEIHGIKIHYLFTGLRKCLFLKIFKNREDDFTILIKTLKMNKS